MLRECGHSLKPESMSEKSVAAAHLSRWLISTIAYCEHAITNQHQPQVSAATSPVQAIAEASRHLSKADIVEIKCLGSPPQPVMTVCICVCILLGQNSDSGWAGAKAMVADVRFLT